MNLDPDLAFAFVQAFPHPIMLFDGDHRLIGANKAARDHPSLRPEPGAACHRVLHGRDERCTNCPGTVNELPYCVTRVERLATPTGSGSEAPLIMVMGEAVDDSGELVYKLFAQPPQAFLDWRQLHDFALGLERRDALDRRALVEWALTFLVDELGYASARFWRSGSTNGRALLQCVTQRDCDDTYTSLVDARITEGTPDSHFSLWATRHGQPVYASSEEAVARQTLGCSPSELPQAPKVPGTDFAFIHFDPEHLQHSILPGGKPHSWIDLPLIEHGQTFGKISANHANPERAFTRDELESASLFMHILNNHLSRRRRRDAERLRAMASISHELRHPTELAMHSVEFLRTRLVSEANMDDIKQFTLRNLGYALNLIHNLNDTQNLALSEDSYSPDPTDLVKDVLHPIVDMIRHQVYMSLIAKKRLAPKRPDMGTLRGRDNRYAWRFSGEEYVVEFEDPLRGLAYHLRATRLQEIFFNLLVNAVKYRVPDRPLRVKVQLAEKADDSFPQDRGFTEFDTIQFVDYGLGVDESERDDIFKQGWTGHAAESTGQVGNGIGLFIARQIALGFGGELILGHPREPTRFDLLIPKTSRSFGGWKNARPRK